MSCSMYIYIYLYVYIHIIYVIYVYITLINLTSVWVFHDKLAQVMSVCKCLI